VNEGKLLFEALAEVAKVTGRAALGHFGKLDSVDHKGDGSPVTVADREAERVAREWIAKRFPDDAVLGEEFGHSGNPAARRRWLIDPIDGTKSFVAGVPLWGSLIAVTEGDEVVGGAINCAAVEETVVAVTGLGAWWKGSRCAVSTTDSLAHATVLTTDDRFPESDRRREAWQTLAGQARVVRTWGDCFGYLLVATGRAEVMVDDKMHAWDSACLLPIIEEAGGVLTDWRGRRTGFGGDTIATNKVLDLTVRSLLVEGGR